MDNRSSEPGAEAGPTHLAISTSQVLHLWGKGNPYNTSFDAAAAIVRALNAQDIPANITVGGVSISVPEDKTMAAARTLAGFNIDIKNLGSTTFAQQVFMAGGLENLAAQDPTGRAAEVLQIVRGDTK